MKIKEKLNIEKQGEPFREVSASEELHFFFFLFFRGVGGDFERELWKQDYDIDVLDYSSIPTFSLGTQGCFTLISSCFIIKLESEESAYSCGVWRATSLPLHSSPIGFESCTKLCFWDIRITLDLQQQNPDSYFYQCRLIVQFNWSFTDCLCFPAPYFPPSIITVQTKRIFVMVWDGASSARCVVAIKGKLN